MAHPSVWQRLRWSSRPLLERAWWSWPLTTLRAAWRRNTNVSYVLLDTNSAVLASGVAVPNGDGAVEVYWENRRRWPRAVACLVVRDATWEYNLASAIGRQAIVVNRGDSIHVTYRLVNDNPAALAPGKLPSAAMIAALQDQHRRVAE